MARILLCPLLDCSLVLPCRGCVSIHDVVATADGRPTTTTDLDCDDDLELFIQKASKRWILYKVSRIDPSYPRLIIRYIHIHTHTHFLA